MAATRPDKIPTWATTPGTHSSGAASVVEPPTAKRAAGFDYQEEPAANYVNWLLNRGGDWITYLDLLVSRPATLVVAASNAASDSKEAADYVCDGTGDEVEINNAMAALPAVGGIVQLTEGTYTVTVTTGQVKVKSNAVLRGAGRGATIIKVPTGGTDSGDGQLIVRNDDLALGNTDLRVEDMTIDGNRANSTKSNVGLLFLKVARGLVHNVRITGGNKSANFGAYPPSGLTLDTCTSTTARGVVVDNCDRQCVRVDGTGTVTLDDVIGIDASQEAVGNFECFLISGPDTILSRCRAAGVNPLGYDVSGARVRLSSCVADATRSGFFIAGADVSLVDCLAKDITNVGAGFVHIASTTLAGCHAVSGTGHGFSGSGVLSACISSGNASQGFQVTGGQLSACVATGNTNSGFTTSTAATLAGCYATLNGQHGYQIAGLAELNGCRAFKNGRTTHNTYDGFQFTSSADRSLMVGCRNRDSDDATRERYAVNLLAGSADVVVTSCYLEQGATAGNAGVGIRDDGTNNTSLPVGTLLTNGNLHF